VTVNTLTAYPNFDFVYNLFLDLDENGPMFGLSSSTEDELSGDNDFWKISQETADIEDQQEAAVGVKMGVHIYSVNPNESFENLPLIMPPVSSGHQPYPMPGLQDSFDTHYDSQVTYGSYSQQQPMHSYYHSPSPRSTMETKVKVENVSKSTGVRRVPKPRRHKRRMHKHSLHSSSDESSDGEMDIKPKRGKFA
jgi:hypothetical protein